MAMTMKVDGLDELSAKLSALEERAGEVGAKALYKGAGVMADAYAEAVRNIKTAPFRYAVFEKRYPSPEEKAAVQGKTGIAHFDSNGSEINTSVGIKGAGYANIAGKSKAVRQIANAINSGTSFMVKQPIFRRAATQTAGKAAAAIAAEADRLINELTK